ncbi:MULTISPECIES: DUF6512 family protein [Clostridium]|uniref:DUF6512 family protein n=1 Tax=Clostridium TaxID=1485 RepID=UPI00071D3648|nr:MULTISPECIES: DUF6512 family protein [Clostridium]MBO1685066.1 hypothetical protein [Clostridium butyricum]MDU0323541.1 DUF6512 family protein [Clostridium butyricum]MDU1340064.1 DUF6512 family protein [Clostridium butyricum]OFS23974.1 hypothetical protein HMPREF3070_06340 [Clostridium sp. HMSC19A10]
MVYNVYLCELLGVIFISITGSLLHFVYDWSNNFKPFALISAVNESTWEHLKIAFWPTLIYSLLEYASISEITNNFVIAKASCLIIIPLSIVFLFYSYTKILKRNYLVVDILIFILSIYFGQKISFYILTMTQLPGFLTTLSLFIILILIIEFSLFTFFPPKFFIFKDPTNGTYGI